MEELRKNTEKFAGIIKLYVRNYSGEFRTWAGSAATALSVICVKRHGTEALLCRSYRIDSFFGKFKMPLRQNLFQVIKPVYEKQKRSEKSPSLE